MTQWRESAWACGLLASQDHGGHFRLESGCIRGPVSWKASPGTGLWLQPHSRRRS